MSKEKQIANIVFCVIVHILILFYLEGYRIILMILCWVIIYITHIQIKLQMQIDQAGRIAQIRNRRKR